MADYKKRAKTGHCTGKGEKSTCNRSERNFAKKELLNMEFISSSYESLSIKNEILADQYDGKVIKSILEEDLYELKTRLTIDLKKKKKSSKLIRGIKNKIQSLQDKIGSLICDENFLSVYARKRFQKQVDEYNKKILKIRKGNPNGRM